MSPYNLWQNAVRINDDLARFRTNLEREGFIQEAREMQLIIDLVNRIANMLQEKHYERSKPC